MDLIIIKEYSVYMDDEYPHNFRKLYRGITVRCSMQNENPQYCWFTIKTRKTKTTIVKSPQEKLNSITFNDTDYTIACEFERSKENKFLDSLSFTHEEYDELKKNIPEFMRMCGCCPKTSSEDSCGIRLLF